VGVKEHCGRALETEIRSLHEHFGKKQLYRPHILTMKSRSVNQEPEDIKVDVVIVVWKDRHALDTVDAKDNLFTVVDASDSFEPQFLGIKCRDILASNLGRYDFYCYMEHDLVIHDSLFFAKLRWFNSLAGKHCVLLPNRYEVKSSGMLEAEKMPVQCMKLYIDGDIPKEKVDPFRFRLPDGLAPETLSFESFGSFFTFAPLSNPHSACYFLTEEQLGRWKDSKGFLDQSTSFMGPMESSATLGILQNFVIYKPSSPMNFLEIQHFNPIELWKFLR
jgi:hypothetical protein